MSLHEAVREFVVAQIELGVYEDITTPSLTTAFTDGCMQSGAWLPVPDDQRAAQYAGLSQIIREQLRRIVPEHPEPKAAPEQLALIPENALLNEYYSVKEEGGKEHWIKRRSLSEDHLQQITARFRALSTHYVRHADALEADWHRTHETAEV